MSKLENLVPPLELCKQIPAGEFEDSALVWVDGNTQNPCIVFVEPRRYAIDNTHRPAPTLEEVLEAIGDLGASFCTNGIQIGNQFYEYPIEVEEALLLWFEVKGIEVE